MKAISLPLYLVLSFLFLCGCGKSSSSSGTAPQGRQPGGGNTISTAPGNAKPSPTQPGPQASNPHFANQLTAIQQKTVRANEELGAIVDRPRRFSGDMLAGARSHVKQLKEARDELSEVRLPAAPEARALYDAYQQWLDNQIKSWNADTQRLAQDPGMAKGFDELMAKVHDQETADLARVKEAHQAFLNATPR
jgi:hypothetical protein